ncbi:5'-methylthioadenosine/S-adenosylhomocysteine nucleosidase [Rothia sp. LK2588]|uniref:5'-methylthioadenosine/S-adenosylhomocysteine nucleosidase n=1 Tax=Rothia sp. LK2588 TaxID=3114369 RepID=UPI0034CD60BC
MSPISLPAVDAAAIVQVAMDEEAAPFLELTEQAGEALDFGQARIYPRAVQTDHGSLPLLLVRSRIGLVNAATAITAALQIASRCELVVSAGTAGGLRSDINVGDLAVGTDYTYADADATAFGYVRGQVPGMPERFATTPELLRIAQDAAADYRGEGTVFCDTMLAGGSFVTAANVANTRELFDRAISVDMETTAIAQVCDSLRVPFIAVRGISDLCGPAADQDFHLGVEIVGPRSAALTLDLVKRFSVNSPTSLKDKP